MGKGEIAHNEQFLLLPVFSTCIENFLPFSSNMKMSFANCLSLGESNICLLSYHSKLFNSGYSRKNDFSLDQSKIVEGRKQFTLYKMNKS